MTDAKTIERLVGPTVEAAGFRLVRVSFGGGSRPVLQLMAEPLDGSAMTLDLCAGLSRQVSAVLDAADPIPANYVLQVSSPGIDRPLVTRDDFCRFAGSEAQLELDRPVGGRKRFRGKLLGRSGDQIRLVVTSGEVSLPLAAITRAKLVLTDELLAMAQKQAVPN